MEGLNGVIFAEAIHYFPFILINLVASLNNIDKSMEESHKILVLVDLIYLERLSYLCLCLVMLLGHHLYS